MKLQPKNHADKLVENRKMPCGRTLLVGIRMAFMCALIAVAGMLTAPSAHAQGIRFQFNQLRATVPVNSTNFTVLGVNPNTNNSVVLVNTVFPDLDFTNHVTNVVFSVSGLPANARAVLVDANGNLLPSTTQSTNLFVQLYTTNITEGTYYTFTVNADGRDSNGAVVTNSFPLVLQSAHIWKGSGYGVASFLISNNWSNATNWDGGVPTSSSEVVFTDYGGQTNIQANSGLGFTNIGIDASVEVASLRFAQAVNTNSAFTNAFIHTIRIANGVTLSVTGSNGFSLMRDYMNEFNYSPDSGMGVNFVGTNGTLYVSNPAATFGIMVGSATQPTLSVSNLGTMVTYVQRMAFSDYTAYPNYRALNNGFNGGRDQTNYGGLPRRFWNNVYLAKTNIITATYKNPDNYNNEFTRQYAMTLQNNEQNGNGSSQNTFFFLGTSNIFYMDGVCFIGGSSASGNTGGAKFGRGFLSTAIFRGTNGGRMSVFTVSDDGGTNQASSNVKATVDFTGVTNYVDILADRLYIARDRTMIASNQTPNVQGDLTIGYGNVDVNTAYLGYQEHSNKVDWTSLYGAQPYLNYCQGRLVVTNGGIGNGLTGVFKVNGNLILGYTADINPPGSSQLYNNFGRVTIYSNATVIVSNIICDGGLNYYDNSGRQNSIIINLGGNLVVSNTVGFPNLGADANSGFAAADPRGMVLDNLTMTAGKLTLNVDPAKTNIFVRSLSTPGTVPSVIKVAQLTGVSSYPVQIPVISYQGSASPFMVADVSALGAGFFCYVLNNTASKSVDLFITTNSPNNLIWTGNQDSTWNTTSINWVTATGGTPTNFNLGDLVTFNDSSIATNVTVDTSVVPGQSGVGVTISNNLHQYTFSGGTVAGTALMVKSGTNSLEFDAVEQGPINVMGGIVNSINGSGFGAVTLWSNTALTNYGSINGGLVSTGNVVSLGTVTGPVSIQGGKLENDGTINTLQGNNFLMGTGVTVSNSPTGVINFGSAPSGSGSSAWDVPYGSTLVNMGGDANNAGINLWQNRMNVEGALYGTGTIADPNGGGYSPTALGLVRINGPGVMSAGPALEGVVSTMRMYTRLDWESDPATAPVGFGTLRVDVDFSNPQTNDIITCDRWNNDTGFLLMTNINPVAGVFSNGQTFTIFVNSSGRGTNFIDTSGFCPNVEPFIPGPGLVWGTTNFNVYGSLSVTTNTMVWDGTPSANWSTNIPGDTSWKPGQLFQNSVGAFFGDNASGSTTVNLITNVAPAGFSGPPISNNATIFPGVVVSNATKNYVITGLGKVTGPTTLYKTGPGSLAILNTNDFTGNIILENGSLAVSNFGGIVNISSLGVAGGGQMKNIVIFEGGKMDYVGTTNCVLNQLTQIEPAGGIIGVASTSNTFTLGKVLVGPGGLTKTGPGDLVLNGANSILGGGVTVSGGTLRLGAGNAIGTNGLTLNNGVVLETTNSALNFTNPVNVVGTGIGFNFLQSTNILSGPWTGAGSVTFSNTFQFVFDGSLSNFSGSISFGATTANYQFNNTTNKSPTNGNPCTGSALASFDLGTGFNTLSNLNGSGLTYFLGALSGGPNTILGGRSTNSATLPINSTYNIGANGNSTTFSGKIADGVGGAAVSVVKTGTGRLLLNGTSTYTGSTTISNGVLGGTGSIASALTVVPGGTLSPGSASSVGVFTVNNNAALGGAVVMKMNRTNPGQSNDLLVVTGTLTGTGGTLTVTNIGPGIVNGSKFKLFSKPITGFTSTTLPSGGGSYVWNNNLGVDGTITLTSGGVNPNPTNIVSSVSGGTFNMSWPADHTGWLLQVQTNPLSIGIYTNWFPVAGSTSTNSVNAVINMNSGSVFYRLLLQ